MSGASLISFYRVPAISCSISGRTLCQDFRRSQQSYCIVEHMVPGAFLADIIPFLKYVPEWCQVPEQGCHDAETCNTTFAATEELTACDSSPFPYSSSYLICIRSQASNDYDPSFVTEWSNIPTTLTKTLICWKTLPSRRMWVSTPISYPLF